MDYDGGGAGKGADVRLLVDDKVTSTGRVDATVGTRFSIDEGADVGMDRGSPVAQRVIGDQRFSAFNGTINKVTLEIYP